MHTTLVSKRYLSMGFALLILAAAALPGAARAEGPACPSPKCAAEEIAVPLLSDIPFVGRLFKTMRYVAIPQEGETLGIDFDFEICQDCPDNCPAGVCQAPRTQLVIVRGAEHAQAAAACCEAARCCGKE